ncbi:hypothetical protein NG819_14890 [Pseudarthrobacter sp. Fe7]|nr:hypothetical protein NG819_14890 [Pseudarthrobacter sp. Fe7]
MEPFTDTNTPPLSIAQADWALHDERDLALLVAQKADTDLLALHETLIAAVTIRVGEVEAAEWALDQAKTSCDVEIAAALAAGVPAEKILMAAGDLASIPTELAEILTLRPPTCISNASSTVTVTTLTSLPAAAAGADEMENLATQKQRRPASEAAPGSAKWWLGTSLTRVTLRTRVRTRTTRPSRCRSRLGK